VTRIAICHSMVNKALLQGLQHLTGHRLCCCELYVTSCNKGYRCHQGALKLVQGLKVGARVGARVKGWCKGQGLVHKISC
jgi:hypothetical protein